MTELASIIESILFASGEPIPVSRLSLVLEKEVNDIISAADELSHELISSNHGIRLLKLEDKLQLCSDASKAVYITRALETRKPPMLSNPALETLAVIAYFQPVTLAYISKIRGVDSSYTVSSLSDKGLIEEKDRLDAPGRPILYGTTDAFLRTMGLEKIEDLPALPDMASNSAIEELKEKIDSLSEEKNNNTDNSLTEVDNHSVEDSES